eukprot:1786541-Prymnesium_polylepis.1
MHTPLCSPTDQGTCASLSRWDTAPPCVSGSWTRGHPYSSLLEYCVHAAGPHAAQPVGRARARCRGPPVYPQPARAHA